jgi:hypothetical protein
MKTQSLILTLALWTTVTCSLAARPASAQEVTDLKRQQSLGLDAGLESAFITRVTYMHRIDWNAIGNDSRLYARFTLPVASPDFADFALDAGVRSRLLGEDGWGLQMMLGPVLRNTENSLFTASAFGFRALLLPGYQTERWGLLAELGIEQMLTTHLSQSGLYKRTYYSGANSGWYAITGGVLRAGLRGGARFGHVELSLAAGVSVDEQLQAQMPPFYATFGTSYAF